VIATPGTAAPSRLNAVSARATESPTVVSSTLSVVRTERGTLSTTTVTLSAAASSWATIFVVPVPTPRVQPDVGFTCPSALWRENHVTPRPRTSTPWPSAAVARSSSVSWSASIVSARGPAISTRVATWPTVTARVSSATVPGPCTRMPVAPLPVLVTRPAAVTVTTPAFNVENTGVGRVMPLIAFPRASKGVTTRRVSWVSADSTRDAGVNAYRVRRCCTVTVAVSVTVESIVATIWAVPLPRAVSRPEDASTVAIAGAEEDQRTAAAAPVIASPWLSRTAAVKVSVSLRLGNVTDELSIDRLAATVVKRTWTLGGASVSVEETNEALTTALPRCLARRLKVNPPSRSRTPRTLVSDVLTFSRAWSSSALLSVTETANGTTVPTIRRVVPA